jgi:hypothetical protein
VEAHGANLFAFDVGSSNYPSLAQQCHPHPHPRHSSEHVPDRHFLFHHFHYFPEILSRNYQFMSSVVVIEFPSQESADQFYIDTLGERLFAPTPYFGAFLYFWRRFHLIAGLPQPRRLTSSGHANLTFLSVPFALSCSIRGCRPFFHLP